MSKSNKYLTHHSHFPCYCCGSVAQLCLTLQIHELQHTRVPCPSPSPGVCSNLCPLSWWCWQITHLILSSPDSFNHSSSVAPFSSCPQSFPALGSFPMSHLFSSGGQSIRASASVLPVNIQDWFPWGLTGLISLQSRDSQESSPTPQFKIINSLALSFLYSPTHTSIHDYWKNHGLD